MLEIKKLPEKAEKVMVDWGKYNAITYDITKIEIIIFSKVENQKLVKQLTDI